MSPSWPLLRLVHVLFASLQLAAVGWVDFLTGYEVSLTIFYFLPIAYAAWFLGRGWSVAVAGAAAVILTSAELGAGRVFSKAWMAWQYGGMRVLVFAFVAYSFSHFHRSMEEAQARVRRLEGSLTFCNGCTRVRTGAGTWGKLDEILRETPELAARSTLCPTCARTHSGRTSVPGDRPTAVADTTAKR